MYSGDGSASGRGEGGSEYKPVPTGGGVGTQHAQQDEPGEEQLEPLSSRGEPARPLELEQLETFEVQQLEAGVVPPLQRTGRGEAGEQEMLPMLPHR